MQGHIPAARVALIERIATRARRLTRGRAAVPIERLVRAYYHGVAEEDLAAHDRDALAHAALRHLALAAVRRPGQAVVRVFNPDPAVDGFRSARTLVLVATDDMPFLVDSLGIVLGQSGLNVHFLVHPVLSVSRDRRGRLTDLHVDAAPAGTLAESWQLVEVDRESEPDRLDALRRRVLETLDDVRCVTSDWGAMRRRGREIAADLRLARPPVAAAEASEARALLEWMEEDHFTFLGYREYRLRRGRSHDLLEALPATGLGLLRPGRHRAAGPPVRLSGEIRKFARSSDLLIITKANSLSTVHRATHLDYVGIKTFDRRGRIAGERRFIGLWTSTAYGTAPRNIPVLRHKVQRVVSHFGLSPSSHDGKAVMHAVESYPRDELFQASLADLIRTVRGIVNLYERYEVRLFLRRDAFRRFYSLLLYVPRDRYNTQVRQRIERLAMEALGGLAIESQVQLSQSVLVRLQMLVRTDPEAARRVDAAALEQRIAEIIRTWPDRLRQALDAALPDDLAASRFRRWGSAFPAAYHEDVEPGHAVADIERLEELAANPARLVTSLGRQAGQPEHKVQLKIFRRERPIAISDVLPTIENLGLRLISERPYELEMAGGSWWIQDFELEHRRGLAIDLPTDGPRLAATFDAVWHGHADNDGFNRLVLAADLDWREVVVLRTYARWFVQLGLPLSQAYMEEALATNAAAASHLARLFLTRFDPDLKPAARARAEARHREALAGLLAQISRVDDDRIVRAFLEAILATLRTSYFRTDAAGQARPFLSLKIDPRAVAETPLPRPMYEIFVHSPRVEGVHLRMGKVARGGLRWSDRREDFRTEILGLMKAQNVKNTVIVPVGSKGGFVPRRLPPGRDQALAEGTECYRLFIRSLLDLTDNLVAGKVAAPPRVVRKDGDDPYLVVAADKGTARFSDVANAISAEYGFWLGDAFASGGSAGYDHKKMGITARGGWECVKRHFRELGLDIQSQDFTVAGIGDMSGDVFGNGMLLSPHIRLLAAFNHQHIFVDPDPDAARSLAERQRLFALPHSTWEDYDRRLLSRGGGVYPRNAKTVPLAPEARRLLELESPHPTPGEVVRAILRLPVDLLWNGGIGTYVKASTESDAEVGDRSNDAVRVNGRELRCRVVGEGGNLGLSQRGRIEYALAGGRLNTDFIDNSGGVNCSDLEVNIKILLSGAAQSGRLPRKARDRLLARMTAEVGDLVLRGNYMQGQALSVAESTAADMLAEHAHVIRALERAAGLDRALESLPAEEEIAERRRLGKGLTRPELAMILSYSKLWLYDRLIQSNVPEDPYLGRELLRYFPAPLQRRFAAAVPGHPLRREIIVTATTNSLVNRMGPVFAIRCQEDTGADIAAIARAYSIAREITEMRELWADVERLDNKVPAALQYEMLHVSSRLLRYLTYWVLANLRDLDIERAVSALQPGLRELQHELPALLVGLEAEQFQRSFAHLESLGAPPRLARRVAGLSATHSAVDVVEVARQRSLPVVATANAYFELGARTGIDWIRCNLDRLAVDGHWQAVARASLREEAFALQRRLCATALSRASGKDLVATAEAWLAGRGRELEALRRTVEEMRGLGQPDFATLSVALQAVRRLADS